MADNRLNGLNPLSYIGVNPYTPAPFVIHPRAPTTNDWQNFELGTFWLNNLATSSTYKSVWVLVSLTGNRADWALLSSGGGDLTSLLDDANATILPDANGQIKVAGGATSAYTNITTLGNVNPNEIQVRLKDSIQLPDTNAAGTTGLISLGGIDFISNYPGQIFGTSNIFIGNAGNRTTASATNTCIGIGRNALLSVVNATNCIALGLNSAQLITAGTGAIAIGTTALENSTSAGGQIAIGTEALRGATSGGGSTVAIGFQSLLANNGQSTVAVGHLSGQLVTSSEYCCLLGFQAGSVLTTNDSSNICINSNGVSGDNNTLRIGAATGAGNQQLNASYIAGIYGQSYDGGTGVPVLVDINNKLGTAPSSIRYKENINDLGSLSDNIYKMRPVVFNYKNRPAESKSIGLIAEEVNLVMPSLVVRNAEGEIETVKYQDLSILLLNEIKKLKNRIDELERRYYDIGN